MVKYCHEHSILCYKFVSPNQRGVPDRILVLPGGQVIFGAACGSLAMLLRLYVNTPIPSYMAVLAMNTFVPLIDAAWRPRVLGRPWLWRWRSKGEL